MSIDKGDEVVMTIDKGDGVVMSIDKGDEVVMSIDKGDEDVLVWDAFVRHEWKCSADNNNTLIGHTGTKAVPVVRK